MIVLLVQDPRHLVNTVQATIRKKEIFREKYQLMKKKKEQLVNRSLVFISFFIVTSLVACSRCEDCELNGKTERICETEFDSPDQYELAIEYEEDNGATCTAVGF